MIKLLLAFTFLVLNASTPAQAADEDLEYFKQFMYRVETDNSDPDFPESSYHFLMTQWDFDIPIGNKQSLNTPMTIYMFEDGTFKMQYRENIITEGQSSFYPKACRIVNGKWSVPDTKLVLTMANGAVLAEGARHFDNGKHEVLFTFVNYIVSAELKGQTISGGTAQGSPHETAFCF